MFNSMIVAYMLVVEGDRWYFDTKEEAEAQANGLDIPHKQIVTLTDVINPETQVSFVWGIEDVQGQGKKLTDEQAMEVLEFCKDSHDCNFGMTWEHIDQAINALFPDAEDTEEEENDN